MTITLNPQIEERLREKAERDGQNVDMLANSLITAALEWEAQDQMETVEGIRRGLEDFATGRYSPAAQVFSEIKARHGIAN